MSSFPESMDAYREQIDAFMADVWKQRAAVIEEACERALQGGEHGVLVETEVGLEGWSVTAIVHPGVPYGQVCEKRIP